MRDEPESLDVLLQRGYRYALSLAHRPDGAEDLLQDACLRISMRGGPWRSGYLFTIIRNRFIDLYRRAGKVSFSPVDDVPLATNDAPVDALPESLESALGELRPQDREMLYLQAVEGYTAEEIGQLTDRPRGTVLSAIFRAKKKLRELLSGDAKVVS